MTHILIHFHRIKENNSRELCFNRFDTFLFQLLDADDAKYNSYFWWRKFYRRRFNHHQSMCDLCEKLHTDKTPNIYPDMREWWVDQAKCSTKTILSQDDMI